MSSLTVVMGLRKVYEAFQEEVDLARRCPMPEYYRFLKALSFYDFIERVITACAMYPRCLQTSMDTLEDLSYVIHDEMNVGKFRLVQFDQDRLRWQIQTAGQAVFSILEGHRYYFESHQMSRQQLQDPHYATDLVGIVDLKQINNFTFVVTIEEHHYDDDVELPQKRIEQISSIGRRI